MSSVLQVLASFGAQSLWSKTVVAMHMDDTGLTDVKGHTVTLSGGVARSATQSQFGGFSAFFDGATDYLSVATGSDAVFGTNDFSVSAWIYVSSLADDRTIFDGGGGVTNRPVLHILTNGKLEFYANGTAPIASSVGAIATGTWYYVEISKKGGTQYLFIDGALVNSNATAVNYAGGTSIRVGMSSFGSFESFHGYIDDLRVINGSAENIVAYTRPTAAFVEG